MSTNLKAIAARYAGALKASESITLVGGVTDRPTPTDIWYWQLEQTVTRNVERKREVPSPVGEYQFLALYNHRDCLNSKQDVQRAPDDVLLDALGLHNVANWGWLRFIISEMGMTSMLINNWGWDTLKGYEDAHGLPVEPRRAQAGLYFLDIMRERGFYPLTELANWVGILKEKYKGIQHKELSDAELVEWLRGRNEYAWMVYICNTVEIGAHERGGMTVQYSGTHRVQFAREIHEAAERRRQVWNTDYSCDCEKPPIVWLGNRPQPARF